MWTDPGPRCRAQDYVVKPFNVLVAIAHVQIAMARVRSAALWKQTADSLRERRQTQAIFNQTFQFMGLLDRQGIVLEVNRAALEGIKAGRESVVGRPFWRGPWWEGSPQVRERLEEAVADAVAGQTVNFEAEHPGKGGGHCRPGLLLDARDRSGRVAWTYCSLSATTSPNVSGAKAGMLEAKEAAEPRAGPRASSSPTSATRSAPR